MSIILDFDGMCSSKNIFLCVICSSRLSGRLFDSVASTGVRFTG